MRPTIDQALIVMWALLSTANALARDGNQWQDPRIKEWFENLKQPDHPPVSCCGEADAYEADDFEVEGDHYVAVITGHRAVTTIPPGSRIPVPRQKMKFDAGNPTGRGIILIDSQRRVLCYVTPAAACFRTTSYAAPQSTRRRNDCVRGTAAGERHRAARLTPQRKHLLPTAGGREAEEQTLTDRLY
jgi:hypothetical protein